MKNVALSDNDLIFHYQSGDESALKTLVSRYEKRLFTYIMISVKNKELAEDIFQDTFIKVINTIRSGNYHEEGKFYQWIMRIANNLRIDYYRKVQRLPIYENKDEFDIFEVLSDQEESIEQKIIREQIYSDVSNLVEFLPLEQREVLVMRIYQDFSFNRKSYIGILLYDESTYQIIVEDDGIGFDTTKAQSDTKRQHIGMENCKSRIKTMCNGEVVIESTVGVGTTLNFWFQHDHLDRPPMGDLAGSLVMLFSAHEDIHFIYTHITDDGEFVFDTDEIKEALDGMPMNDVHIMQYLKEMIQENLKEINYND